MDVLHSLYYCKTMKGNNKFQHKEILWIFFLACLVRIGFILLFPNEQVSDALNYKTIAIQFAATGTYSNNGYYAYVAPGFPVFLSVFYAFGNTPDLFIKLIQVLISSGSVLLLYAVCQSFFSKRTALLSALSLALYLNHIAYCSLLLTETLFTFLLLLFVWLGTRKPSGAIHVSGALVWAVMILIKPQAIVLGACILLFHLLVRKITLQKVAFQTAIAILLVCGWMYRNQLRMGAFIISSNGPVNIFIGNNEKATGKYEEFGLVGPEVPETEQMHYYRTALREHPKPMAEMPALMASKFFFLFITDAESIRYWMVNGLQEEQDKKSLLAWKWVFDMEYILIVLGCALAMLGMVRKKLEVSFLFFLPLLFIVVLQLVYFGDPRFHFPAMPFLLPVAVSGWGYFGSLFRKISELKRRPV